MRIRPAAADDVRDEVRDFYDRARADLIREGLSPEAAARAARRELGDEEHAREQVAAYGWEHAVERTLSDLRYALRLYRATPGASLIAVGVLAISMAFVASFLSLYVDLVVRPPPGFERGNDIVTFGYNDGLTTGGLPYDLIRQIQEETVSLTAAAGTAPFRFEVGRERETLVGEVVTPEFFDGIRPKLALGRGFTVDEHQSGAEPVTVISYEYWLRHFDGRDDVLGRTIDVRIAQGLSGTNGQAIAKTSEPTSFRIVGVMSPTFTGTLPPGDGETTLWLAVERAIPLILGEDAAGQPFEERMRGIARMAAGVGPQAVISELTTRFSDELAGAIRRPSVRFEVIRGIVFDVFIQRSTQRQLRLFLAASILVALVATANVSLFLLARAPDRRRELSIRMCLGAPVKRLAQQLVSEATLLVVVGSALGLLVSIWLSRYLRGLTILRDAQWRDVTLLDWRVLALVAGILLILAIVVSLAPMLGLKKLGIAAGSRRFAARPSPAQRVAGAGQIAIAGVLAGAAVAFTFYLGELMFGDPGYATRNLYAVGMSTAFPSANDSGRTSGSNTMADNARRRETILGIPGVTGASIATAVPGMTDGIVGTKASPPYDPTQEILFRAVAIDGHYADLLDLNLLYGRAPRDREVGVVLVNRTFAMAFFGREDVAGEPFPLRLGPEGMTIVGVLEDLSYGHPDAKIVPMSFIAFDFPTTESIAVVETTRKSADLLAALQDLSDSGAIEARILSVTPLSEIRNQVLGADRARSFLITTMAALVVILAAFGFYGTQHYLVAIGRHEFAIRAALGAGPLLLGRLVFRRGLLLGLPGLCLALPLTFGLVAWLRGDYISTDISPTLITTTVATGLLLVVIIASIGPVRQARRTQPAPLLRED